MTPQHFLVIPISCVCFSLVTVIFVVGKEWALPLVHYQLQQIHQANSSSLRISILPLQAAFSHF